MKTKSLIATINKLNLAFTSYYRIYKQKVLIMAKTAAETAAKLRSKIWPKLRPKAQPKLRPKCGQTVTEMRPNCGQNWGGNTAKTVA